MKVLSVNLGPVTEVGHGTRRVPSAFIKRPVDRAIAVDSLGLAGDAQGNREVHGGERQALYVYPHEHYAFWRQRLARDQLSAGAFAENLTTEGWLETDTRPGDILRIGSTEVEVTRPRFPCFKLGLAFDRPTIEREFLESCRTGFYLAVREPGKIGPGDPITPLHRARSGLTIAEIAEEKLRASRSSDPAESSE